MTGDEEAELATQESVYEFFEAFSAAAEQYAEQHWGAQEPGEGLAGRLILSGGMGRRGGAQPLAATMTGAAFLGIDADVQAIKQCLKRGECDFLVNSLDEALRILKNAVRKRENLSVGLAGNCAELVPEMAARGVVPDMVTDQTPLLDAAHAYLPTGKQLAEARALRERDAATYERRARESSERHIEGLLRLRQMGSLLIDTGNGLSEAARRHPGAPCAIPEFAKGAAQPGEDVLLRWVALSGEASDREAIDTLALRMFSARPRLRRWIDQSRRLRGGGRAGRIVRLAAEDRVALARAIHAMVGEGGLKGAVAISIKSSANGSEWCAPLRADGSAEAAARMESALRQRA